MTDTVRVTIPAPSPAQTLNTVDYKKIAKGAALAFGAAFLVTIIDWVALGQFDWVLFKTVCLPAAISTGANALMKWYQGQPQQ